MAAAIEAGMCFVNSQNVRDLRQPFGGTKASGTGREGGTWSYEVFLEPKNVCVSLGSHHIPRWGASNPEPVSDAEISLRHQPGSRRAAAISRRIRRRCSRATSSAAEERGALDAGDIGLIYVLGANGQLLMHFAAFLGMPWADYIAAMRAGVARHGPVRAGVYAHDDRLGREGGRPMSLVFAGICSHAPGITGRAHMADRAVVDEFHGAYRGMARATSRPRAPMP